MPACIVVNHILVSVVFAQKGVSLLDYTASHWEGTKPYYTAMLTTSL